MFRNEGCRSWSRTVGRSVGEQDGDSSDTSALSPKPVCQVGSAEAVAILKRSQIRYEFCTVAVSANLGGHSMEPLVNSLMNSCLGV